MALLTAPERNSMIFTIQFWKDTAERVVSSSAQGFLTGAGLMGVASAADQVSLNGFPWAAAFGAAGGMAVLTFAKSLLANPIGNQGTASFTKAVEPVI